MSTEHWMLAASEANVRERGCMTAHVESHTLALFAYGERVYAVDNRCPHMGFPLKDGSLKDGILTCHWHHARFDLASGGAFDLFADDVRTFPVQIRDGEVWVDVTLHGDIGSHRQQRLQDGLERNIPLVIAKSVLGLSEQDIKLSFRTGLDFGVHHRQDGWGQGLTMMVCMLNLLPTLAPEDRSRAIYHGLSAVARDTQNMPARFMVQPLPNADTDIATLKRWLRKFIEVRDSEGAERCLVSAIRAGASRRELADMLFAAVTDHRYIQLGHPLDFTNKALEALDYFDWDPTLLSPVLTSLIPGYAFANRMEESNAWRNPIDLVAMLEQAFVELESMPVPSLHQADAAMQARMIETLLGNDPAATVHILLGALREGVSEVALAGVVAYAAALRIARFHISNEFGDWDTALHTFTFANAVHQGLRRLHGQADGLFVRTHLLRGVFDAAMSLYLDRFLNVPAARLPTPNGAPLTPLDSLTTLFDKQQQVDAAAEVIAAHIHEYANSSPVIAMLGRLLLREDRDFHTIQSLEAAVRQYQLLADQPEAAGHALIAATRYLAAHAPTMRAQGQTFNIAQRLAHGERLFEE